MYYYYFLIGKIRRNNNMKDVNVCLEYKCEVSLCTSLNLAGIDSVVLIEYLPNCYNCGKKGNHIHYYNV